MVRLIESELRDLKLKLLDMADLVRLQLDQAVTALEHHDLALAQRIEKREKEIDKYDNKISKRCERIFALYQPVANDLRFVFSVLKINAFLEQTGDSVHGIVHRMQHMTEPPPADLVAALRLPELYQATQSILYEALRSYFRESAEAARKIFEQDDIIDDIHKASFKLLVARIQAKPALAADYIHLLHIIQRFEKVGDYAVSIAEEALFHMEGTVYRHSDLKHLHRNEPPATEEDYPLTAGEALV